MWTPRNLKLILILLKCNLQLIMVQVIVWNGTLWAGKAANDAEYLASERRMLE